ncbi:hypothetical protein KAR10_02275 [bacterium]|nr:hypothetical protein [bacterium]
MGRKQKKKLEQRIQEKQFPSGKPGKPRGWLAWLIGVVAFFTLLILALVIYVQINKGRFIKLGVLSTSSMVRTELEQHRANFSFEETQQLSTILTEIELLAGQKQLAPRAGGNLNFILRVLREIVQEGNLEPGEVEKIKSMLNETRRYLKRQPKP